MESIGIVLNTIAATMRTEGLLKQSQLLTQELQARQTELTTKQEELHATNEELQEKALLLEYEKKQVEAKNLEIDMARRAIEEKAEQLALTSKYKSEFLANMSHELRTPLNSLLILSKLLADNPQGNLSEKQTEFARTINSAGTDLLSLINDILDLSKIESGTVSIEVGDVPLKSLRQNAERTFRQLAADKNLAFEVDFDSRLPLTIRTDEKRLQQVVLNLLSNAFKFTSQGSVTLGVKCASEGWTPTHPVLSKADSVLAISVTDTGIGIPEDKQRLIFEAFQQADGTTSRRYGGTGLGLSISREIARLLGGELQVSSKPGEGSTFTLYVPQDAVEQNALPIPAELGADNDLALPAPALVPEDLGDDRDSLGEEAFVLIVEDDPTFAAILLEIAHESGLKGVLSGAGAGTLAMARKLQPDAITLDLGLSDIDGSVLLDLLKHDPDTQHIPVHVISGKEEAAGALALGAIGSTEKPASREALLKVFSDLHKRVQRKQKRVLVVSDSKSRKLLTAAVADPGVKVDTAASLVKGIAKSGIAAFDAIVVAAAEAQSVAKELEALGDDSTTVPVIIAGEGDVDEKVNVALNRLASNWDILVSRSEDELEAIVTTTLRRGKAGPMREESSSRGVPELAGATILVVDDDIRNIYSLTSVLESYDAVVLHAERGREGISILEQNPSIDVALIDIMMPEMDGYETMQQIRSRENLAEVPLIAVTAKAMKGDRQKCLDAGASDYIAKPVDMDLLLALLRVWIGRARDKAASPQLAQNAAE
jgi:signal transduction histidine kinase/CheY-like chemotaxis protein